MLKELLNSPLFGALLGGLLAHIGHWVQAKIGQPKTAIGQAELALAQSVIPAQAGKAEKWIGAHAPAAAPVADAVIEVASAAVAPPAPQK